MGQQQQQEQDDNAITFDFIRTWAPLVISIGALLLAYYSQMAEMNVRMTVLEITIKENVFGRIERLEKSVEKLEQNQNSTP